MLQARAVKADPGLTLSEEGGLALWGLTNLASCVCLAPAAMRSHGLRENHLQIKEYRSHRAVEIKAGGNKLEETAETHPTSDSSAVQRPL